MAVITSLHGTIMVLKNAGPTVCSTTFLKEVLHPRGGHAGEISTGAYSSTEVRR